MTLNILANGMLGMVKQPQQNNCDLMMGILPGSAQITVKLILMFFLVSCSVITFELKPTLPYLICDIYNMLCQCTWLS